MDIPIALYNDIVAFFLNLSNMHDSDGRRALVYQAGIDAPLLHHITWNAPSAKFFPVFVTELFQYGTLQDGRYALEAVLETTKQCGGIEHQHHCETLLQHLGNVRNTLINTPKSGQKPFVFFTKMLSSAYTKWVLVTLLMLVILLGLLLSRQGIHQSSKGKQSPNVVSERDVEITYED